MGDVYSVPSVFEILPINGRIVEPTVFIIPSLEAEELTEDYFWLADHPLTAEWRPNSYAARLSIDASHIIRNENIPAKPRKVLRSFSEFVKDKGVL